MKSLIIIGNWKTNPQTLAEAKRLFNFIKNGVKNFKDVKTVICPPFIYLPIFRGSTSENINIGAQDCFWQEKGAYPVPEKGRDKVLTQRGSYTGEISPKMLKNLGCKYVILGHSERRMILGEKDEMINKKVKAALKNNLKVILCVGDRSRKSKEDIKEVYLQLKNCLKGLKKSDFKNLIITYEPVWAVGTGKNCDYKEAREAKEFIKKQIPKVAPILYGGSVSSKNAADYIKKAGFQGLLIGSASLNPKEFVRIIKSVTT